MTGESARTAGSHKTRNNSTLILIPSLTFLLGITLTILAAMAYYDEVIIPQIKCPMEFKTIKGTDVGMVYIEPSLKRLDPVYAVPCQELGMRDGQVWCLNRKQTTPLS